MPQSLEPKELAPEAFCQRAPRCLCPAVRPPLILGRHCALAIISIWHMNRHTNTHSHPYSPIDIDSYGRECICTTARIQIHIQLYRTVTDTDTDTTTDMWSTNHHARNDSIYQFEQNQVRGFAVIIVDFNTWYTHIQ